MADMSLFVPKKMAEWERKVDHLIWQIEVASDEKWEELIKLQGLVGNLAIFNWNFNIEISITKVIQLLNFYSVS